MTGSASPESGSRFEASLDAATELLVAYKWVIVLALAAVGFWLSGYSFPSWSELPKWQQISVLTLVCGSIVAAALYYVLPAIGRAIRSIPYLGETYLESVATALELKWMTEPPMVRVWESDVTRGFHKAAWDVGPEVWDDRVVMRGEMHRNESGEPCAIRVEYDEALGKLLLWFPWPGEVTPGELEQFEWAQREMMARQDTEVNRAKTITRRIPHLVRSLEQEIDERMRVEETDFATDSVDEMQSVMVDSVDEWVDELNTADDEEVAEKYAEERAEAAEESSAVEELLEEMRSDSMGDDDE